MSRISRTEMHLMFLAKLLKTQNIFTQIFFRRDCFFNFDLERMFTSGEFWSFPHIIKNSFFNVFLISFIRFYYMSKVKIKNTCFNFLVSTSFQNLVKTSISLHGHRLLCMTHFAGKNFRI